MRIQGMEYTEWRKKSAQVYNSFEKNFDKEVAKLKDIMHLPKTKNDNSLEASYAFDLIGLAVEKSVDFSSLPLEFFSLVKKSYGSFEENSKVWESAYKLGCPIIFLTEKFIERILEEETKKNDYNNINIEQELRKIGTLKIRNINASQLALINAYAKKILLEKGLDTKIVIFSQKGEDTSFAKYMIDTNLIYIEGVNNYDETVRDVVQTIIHEIIHAEQQKNINNERYDLDDNLDLMIKDEFLRYSVLDDYKDKYYNRRTIEFDAELKAYLQAEELFNTIDDEFKENLEQHFMDYQIQKAKQYNSKKLKISGFNLERKTSLFSSKHLDEYLISVLNSKGLSTRSNYLKRVMRHVKYDEKTKTYTLKDIKDLFDDYCKGEDSKIYFNIMKQKLNPNKYPNTYKKDVEKLNELMINIEEYPITIKQALLELSVYANKTKYDIYKDYFDSYVRKENQETQQVEGNKNAITRK